MGALEVPQPGPWTSVMGALEVPQPGPRTSVMGALEVPQPGPRTSVMGALEVPQPGPWTIVLSLITLSIPVCVCECSAQREGLLTESAPDEASLTLIYVIYVSFYRTISYAVVVCLSVHHTPVLYQNGQT